MSGPKAILGLMEILVHKAYPDLKHLVEKKVILETQDRREKSVPKEKMASPDQLELPEGMVGRDLEGMQVAEDHPGIPVRKIS